MAGDRGAHRKVLDTGGVRILVGVLKRSSTLPRTVVLGLAITLMTAATLAPLSSNPAFAAGGSCTPSAPNTNCVVYTATGADQSFMVPAGVTSVTAHVAGAGGEISAWPTIPPSTGGAGGLTVGTIAVTTGQVLAITAGDITGYGGGGTGGAGTRAAGGHGGGLSAVWSGASFSSEPYLLAGGGGGAAGAGGPPVSGGAGGGLTGGNGSAVAPTTVGGGGSQTAGGGGGNGSSGDGSKYLGGSGIAGVDGGGGGGGGWFGGGAGHAQPTTGGANSDSGGGGGSGYIGTGTTSAFMTASGGALQNTSGTVTLEWIEIPPTTFTQPSVPRVGLGDNGTTGLQSTAGMFTKYVITAPTWVTITGYSGCVGSDYLLAIASDGSTATCTYTAPTGVGLTTNKIETLTFTVSPGAAVSASLAGSIEVFEEDGTSQSFPLHVNTPPVIPVLTGPANGSVVKTSTPPITGIGQDGDIITVTDENDTLLCTALVAGGVWSCTPTVALTDGDHTLTPTAEDPNGIKTPGLPFEVTINTTEPIAPTSSSKLPATGADPLPLIGTGLTSLLLGVGLLAVSGSRRRTRA